MKKFLIIFLIEAIAFGLVMAWINDGSWGEKLWMGVISGITFGLVMAFTYPTIEKVILKKSGYVEGQTKVVHSASWEVKLPINEAFNLCVESLRTLPKATIQTSDIITGTVTARTSITWKSWGEIIAFAISESGGSCKIELTSRPRLKTTLVDYGKNLQNIDTIINFLQGKVDMKVTTRGH